MYLRLENHFCLKKVLAILLILIMPCVPRCAIRRTYFWRFLGRHFWVTIEAFCTGAQNFAIFIASFCFFTDLFPFPPYSNTRLKFSARHVVCLRPQVSQHSSLSILRHSSLKNGCRSIRGGCCCCLCRRTP